MKIKRFLFLFLFVFSVAGFVHGQTGIGTNLPHESAQLEVASTDKGMLIPRMSEAQKNSIDSPAKGLLVFQYTGTEGFYYYDGTMWVHLGAQGPPGPPGPSGPPGVDGMDGMDGAPGLPFEGFSARGNFMNVGLAGINLLINWNVGPPLFTGDNFDPFYGIYTVPDSGKYQISATINYRVDEVSTNVILPEGEPPAFQVRRIAPVQTDLITARIPITSLTTPGLIYYSIPTYGTVLLIGNVLLNKGDQIALYYETPIDLFLYIGGSDNPVIWSIEQISE